ncbi:MAG: M23 family peptidase [Verrucomicrobia bacterium]|nr:MAG: M23 family peptidase [Verrucomicrobiota bacterium]RPF86650.1 MAG: M23 family metallopeptidase [Roseibacillus sp. TMED18]
MEKANQKEIVTQAPFRFLFALVLVPVLSCALSAPCLGQGMALQLPTDNRALFESNPEKFYMYVYRTFEGETSKPWQGGGYGFVRTLRRTKEGVVSTRFHEGIDIRPVERDSAGRPLDKVRSIALGRVVYVQKSSGGSNYGKYIVVEHDWGNGPFLSLYAHLSTTLVKEGQRIPAGHVLGQMGYTGAGINRERAHLHLELNILVSLQFDAWHKMKFGSDNRHGLHNGMNLSGLDIANLYLRQEREPGITIPEFLSGTSAYYKVTCPRRGKLELADRYPWIRRGAHHRPSPSWEISFTASGFPLSIAPSHREVSKPLVTYIRTTQSRHEYFTLSRLTGTGRRASLTRAGLQHIALITGDFPK